MFDFCLEECSRCVSTTTMVLDLATVLLGACVGVVAVLYAAPKGYLGHPRRRISIDSVSSTSSYAQPTEQAVGVPAAVATTAVEPAPSPIQAEVSAPEPVPAPAPTPAIYETVQPTPAPVQYAAPSSASFGSPTIARKPTRTYRRRTVPVRSSARAAAASKSSLKQKTKKR